MRARLSRGKSRLVELLFGAYRRRILSVLLLHPEQSFYVREIGRLTGIPAGSLHREVKSLADAGLVTRSSAGNQIRYQADRACPVFEELAGVFRKTVGLADVLREALERLGPTVRLAFVFGSVAQGKERPTSDVDVMVVGKAPFARIVEALVPARERLRREVNPVVMGSTRAIRYARRSSRLYAATILRTPYNDFENH